MRRLLRTDSHSDIDIEQWYQKCIANHTRFRFPIARCPILPNNPVNFTSCPSGVPPMPSPSSSSRTTLSPLKSQKTSTEHSDEFGRVSSRNSTRGAVTVPVEKDRPTRAPRAASRAGHQLPQRWRYRYSRRKLFSSQPQPTQW